MPRRTVAAAITRSHYMVVSTLPLPLGQSVQTNWLWWNAIRPKQPWKSGKQRLISLQYNVDTFMVPSSGRQHYAVFSADCILQVLLMCQWKVLHSHSPHIYPLFHQVLLGGRRSRVVLRNRMCRHLAPGAHSFIIVTSFRWTQWLFCFKSVLSEYNPKQWLLDLLWGSVSKNTVLSKAQTNEDTKSCRVYYILTYLFIFSYTFYIFIL